MTRQQSDPDHPYRRLRIPAMLVAVALVAGIAIGRSTAGTPTTPAATEAHNVGTISSVGPMSASDRTRYEVYRRMNRIIATKSGG
jgi:hypothetical protein